MAITYTWNFDPLTVEYSSASMDNVVTHIHWDYQAELEGTSSLGVSGSFFESKVGVVSLDKVASADFVAYESLTLPIVTGWVTASMSSSGQPYTDVQTGLSMSISRQLNPDTGNKEKPW